MPFAQGGGRDGQGAAVVNMERADGESCGVNT